MKKENRNLAVLVLVAAILISGCVGDGNTKSIPDTQEKKGSISSITEQSIIGKWVKQNKEGSMMIKFDRDGKYRMVGMFPGQDPIIADGVYRFTDDNHIEVTISVSGGTGQSVKTSKIISVSYSTLVLEDQETKGIATLTRYQEK